MTTQDPGSIPVPPPGVFVPVHGGPPLSGAPFQFPGASVSLLTSLNFVSVNR